MDAPALRSLLRAAAFAILARIYRQGGTPAPSREDVYADGLRLSITIEADPRDSLSKIQRAALDVLDQRERKAEDLAERAGYEDAKYFGEALRDLVRVGLCLKTGVNAYRKN